LTFPVWPNRRSLKPLELFPTRWSHYFTILLRLSSLSNASTFPAWTNEETTHRRITGAAQLCGRSVGYSPITMDSAGRHTNFERLSVGQARWPDQGHRPVGQRTPCATSHREVEWQAGNRGSRILLRDRGRGTYGPGALTEARGILDSHGSESNPVCLRPRYWITLSISSSSYRTTPAHCLRLPLGVKLGNDIEFAVRIGAMDVKTKFSLRSMTYLGRLEM